ncbi:MAG: hypothetical protein ACRCX2_10505 [Paraclostridium sp.]
MLDIELLEAHIALHGEVEAEGKTKRSQEEISADVACIYARLLSSNNLSYAFSHYKRIDTIPVLHNFHLLLSWLPEEHLFKYDIFSGYKEYMTYVIGAFYYHENDIKILLPSIDRLIFMLYQYFVDIDVLNDDITIKIQHTCTKIPAIHHKTIKYIKRVFDSAFKKYMMHLDYSSFDINMHTAFTTSNRLITNEFYSIRYMNWELINRYDMSYNGVIDEKRISHNKDKFFDILW